MLACHPTIATAGESHLFPDGVSQLVRNHASRDPLMGLKTWMPRGEFLSAVRAFTDAIFSSMRDATRPEARVVLDKTPTVRPFAKELSIVYPDAKFVHIVRDARDMAGSVVGLWGQGHGMRAWENAANTWVAAVEDIRAHLGPLTYHEVAYEELVADPEAELARIFDFCDLQHTPDFVAACVAFGRAPINTRPSDDRVVAGKWQAERTDAMRCVVRVAGDLMVETGHLTVAERERILRGTRASEVFDALVRKTRGLVRFVRAAHGRREAEKSAARRANIERIGESIAEAIVKGERAAVREAIAGAVVTVDDCPGAPDDVLVGAGSRIVWVRADEHACLVQFRAGDGSRIIHRYFVIGDNVTKVAVQRQPSA